MGSGGSALDPIFWMHHCMVDYSWAKWNIELGNNNPNDPTWINTSWPNNFVDQDGNSPIITAGETILLPLLAYQYESSAIGSNPAAMAEIHKREFQKLETRLKEGTNVKFEIKQRISIAERTEISIAQPFSKVNVMQANDFTALIDTDTSRDKIFASIQYAELPAKNDFFVRVFINMPDANATTPTTDIHYAGSFAFFGTSMPEQSMNMHGNGHKHEPKFLVNITNTLQKLKKNQQLKDGSSISVQLVAVPFTRNAENPESKILLNTIDIIITPIIINGK
jgi:tyrosinase